MRRKTFYLLALVLMCLLPASRAWADEAKLEVTDNSAYSTTTLSLDQTCFEAYLYLGECSGSYSCWLDDPTIYLYAYVQGKWKEVSMCQLSDLGLKGMTECGGSEKWKSHMESLRSTDNYLGYCSSTKSFGNFNDQRFSVAALNPRKNSSSEYWVSLRFYIGTLLQGCPVKIWVRGHWRNNANYDTASSSNEVSLSFGTNNFTTTWPTFGSLKRSSKGQIKYTKGSLVNAPTGWSFGMHLYTDNNYTTKKSEAYFGSSTSTDSIFSGYDDYTPYTLYPAFYLQQEVKKDDENILWDVYTRAWNENFSAVNIPGYPRPVSGSLAFTHDQWTPSITISWKSEVKDASNYSKDGVWTIWRKKTGDTAAPTLVGSVAYETTSFTDKSDLSYNTGYTYYVAFQPTAWNLTSPKFSDMSSSLMQTGTYTITPSFSFGFGDTDATGVTGQESTIDVVWTYKPTFGNASASHQYAVKLYRSINNGDPELVQTYNVQSPNTTGGSYTEKNVTKPCDNYEYYLTVDALGTTYTSSKQAGSISGKSKITTFTATKGQYSGVVKLNWDVQQIGTDETSFIIYRHSLGSDADWSKIYTVSGTKTSYSYDDNTALAGSYYEYRIDCITPCETTTTTSNSVIDDGFALSSGVVSGHVTFGSGMAVEDVKLIMAPQDDTKSQFYSMKVDGTGCGVVYSTTHDEIVKLFDQKDWTYQMYVRPELDDSYTDGTDYIMADVYCTLSLYLRYNETDKNFQIVEWINGTKHETGIFIPCGQFSHVTFAYSKDNPSTNIYAFIGDSIVTAQVNDTLAISPNATCLSVGNEANFGKKVLIKGYIDEVRLWSGRALTADDVKQNYNCVLSGSESNLAIYWPMDEGVNNGKIYDFSKSNGVANGRYGLIKTNTSPSTIIPTTDQLSLCTYTDSLGNYVIRGIPFSGEGTNYTITPLKGIHEFSPIRDTRYISSSSLVHSQVDFTDVSSFKVTGTVYYSGTDYPVEGCNFYVDGTVCAKDGEMIASKADGTYEISVPIGNHYIQVKQNGHTFEGNGRYPLDPNGVGVNYTFIAPVSNLDFKDNTLVTFAGRVVGGDVEGDKHLGFGLSQNNIGKALLTMSPVNTNYRINVVDEVNGLTTKKVNNPNTVECASSTEAINSRSYRGAGDYSTKIYITTDSLTGEFSAKVPPLEYKVESVNIIATGQSLLGNAQVEDLTNPLVEEADSLDTGEKFTYGAALMLAYHSDPVFNVTDAAHTDGALGISTYKFSDVTGSFDVKDIYSVDAATGDISYKYGAPLFIMMDPYTFNIEAYEEFTNYDEKDPVTVTVPLAGTTVLVENALSSSQAVYYEDKDGKKAGEVAELESNEIELDENGKASYVWNAGLPNITAPYTRTISMSYEINGSEKTWIAGGQPGIILGNLSTGTNFITAGPDKLQMILRDPPGTGSHTEWTKGTVTNTSTLVGSQWSSETEVTTVTNFGAEASTATGVGVAVIEVSGVTDEMTIGAKITTEGESSTTITTEVTNERTISTSSEPEYVGAQGDVFIAQSTNIVFGKARQVGFTRTAPDKDEVELTMEDVMTSGLKFGTAFTYTQNYIENVLIPNFEEMKEQYLTTVTQSVIDQYDAGTLQNNTGHMIYLTTLSKDDKNWGSDNNDKDAWGTNATEKAESDGPSYHSYRPANTELADSCYQDSIYWINSQIKTWQKHLAFNEEEKVKAFENRSNYLVNNYSFDSGTSQSFTEENDTTTTSELDWTAGALAVLGNKWGLHFNKTGVTCEVKTETGGSQHNTSSSETTDKATFTYEFAEDGDDDAISVDVLKYGSYSPIFHTRGGQTCNPYEGVEYARYYEPEKKHKISDGTMQIEKPLIDVDQAIMTDVPSGTSANFTLRLTNASEINEDVYYKLLVIDESNSQGAKIAVDGQPLTEGRSIKVPAGETITKLLQLTQSNQSILEYKNIGVVLASPTQYDPTSTWDCIADTVYISAYFVPSSSDVTLKTNTTVLNMYTGTDLGLTFSGFDRNYYNLKAFRLQYKYEGDADWTQIHEYVIDKDKVTQSNELLPTGGSVTYNFDMNAFSDGNYTFRVASVSTNGNEEIYKYSDEIAVYKDVARPTLLGSANPSDGILEAGEDISVRFNEDIRNGALTKAMNFSVTGALNDAAVDHEVGLALTNTETQAQTDVDINLAEHDFSVGFWLNRKTDGTILTLGSSTNAMKMATVNEGHMVVTIAGKEYTSDEVIPAEQWTYVAMSYAQGTQGGKITGSAAYDASIVKLFRETSVGTNVANGKLSVGSGLTGSINQLSLWNISQDDDEMIALRNKSKSASTKGLIGYWKMDEGHGTELTDVARSRNMIMTSENWFINNVNKAAHFDGQSHYALDFSRNSILDDESYAIEMWVRPDEQKAATLLQSGNGELNIGLTESGQVEITTPETTFKTTAALAAETWHHVALNVLRGSSAILYIDGNNALTMTEQSLPALQGDSIIVGANRAISSVELTGRIFNYSNNFEGDIDELRIWNASMQGKYITDNRYCRVDTAMAKGLVAYLPMESATIDANNQVVYDFSLQNVMQPDATLQTEMLPSEAITTPGLKTAPALTNLQYSFTASEREIYITLEDAASRLEGTTVYFTLSNVRDTHDNICVPVVWSAYVRQNPLRWADDSEQQLSVTVGESTTFSATISNTGGTAQEWSLSGLPTWLSASMTEGTLGASKTQTITFTTSDATAIGKYAETIFLVGNSAIYEPLDVALKVNGEVPGWTVNPEDYDKSMNMTAQLYIKNVVCEDPDTRVAAFVGDECRGLAQPQYISTRDAYYLCMTIYGNANDMGKAVDFKVWDSTTGTIYSGVDASQDIILADGNIYGTFNNPVILTTNDNVEQQIDLNRGWNWTSFFVQPADKAINSVMGNYADHVSIVKQRTSFSMSNGTSYVGSLKQLNGATLYMMKTDEALSILAKGPAMSAEEGEQTVSPNWNWLGNPCQSSMTLEEAFAGLNPEVDDLVKSRTAFAIYNGYAWEGTLTSIQPGQGYLYHSNSTEAKTFRYPEHATTKQNKVRKAAEEQFNWFNVDDISSYPGNMTIVAEVYNNGDLCDTLELAAYAGDECRTVARSYSEKYFLAIPGEGNGQTITFRTYLDGQYVLVVPDVTYSNDEMIGSLEEPLRLEISTTNGINNISDDEATDVYDIAGRKLNNMRSVPRGVYIKGGKKQVVK